MDLHEILQIPRNATAAFPKDAPAQRLELNASEVKKTIHFPLIVPKVSASTSDDRFLGRKILPTPIATYKDLTIGISNYNSAQLEASQNISRIKVDIPNCSSATLINPINIKKSVVKVSSISPCIVTDTTFNNNPTKVMITKTGPIFNNLVVGIPSPLSNNSQSNIMSSIVVTSVLSNISPNPVISPMSVCGVNMFNNITPSNNGTCQNHAAMTKVVPNIFSANPTHILNQALPVSKVITNVQAIAPVILHTPVVGTHSKISCE